MGLTPRPEHTRRRVRPSSQEGWVTTRARFPRQLGPRELAVADAVRHRVLRDRVHGDRREQVRPRALRHGAHELLAAPGGRADLRRPRAVQARAGHSAHLAADAAAQVVHLDGRVRIDAAACSTTTPWCRASTRSFRSTSTCRAVRRARKACMYGIMMLQEKVKSERMARQVAPQRDGARPEEPAVHPAVGDRRAVASRSATPFIRHGRACERRASTPVIAGSALGNAVAAPATPQNVPHRGGDAEPVRRRAARDSSAAPSSASTSCGARRRSIVDAARVARHHALAARRSVAALRLPLRRHGRRVSATSSSRSKSCGICARCRSAASSASRRSSPKGAPLDVPSVWDIYKGADWLERECYDMFGIRFAGHPDLRRHPHVGAVQGRAIRCGRTFRCAADSAARSSCARRSPRIPRRAYSMEELSIADAFEDLPADMRQRLARRRDGRESSDGDDETHGRSRALDDRARRAGTPAARPARRRTKRASPSPSTRRRRSSRISRASTCSSTSGRSIRRRTACCASCSSSMARRSCAASRTSATCTAASRRSASTGSTTRSSRGPTARTTSTRPATTSRSRSARSGCSGSRSRSGARCCA